MFCIKCGKEIPEGSAFCCFCGEKQQLKCPSCGIELVSGALFCHNCGKAMTESHEDKTASQSTEVYPSVSGLYRNGKHLSVGKDDLVFFDSEGLYLLNKQWKLIRLKYESLHALSHTSDAVYAVSENYDTKKIILKKYDKNLKLIQERNLCEYKEANDIMDGEYYYRVYYNYGFLDGENLCENIEFLRVNLETGKENRFSYPKAYVEDGILSSFSKMWVDKGMLYFSGEILEENTDPDYDYKWDTRRVVLVMDFEKGKIDFLWREVQDEFNYRDCGKPEFFDFEKGIMWTQPAKDELNALQIGKIDSCRATLVARKIERNGAMLTQYGTWHNISVDDLCYFDGEYAFYSPNYYSFCGVDRLGNRSEAWNNTSHGRAETAMIWNGKIVADLFADYWYTVFPLGFDKPARDSISKLECNDINE